MRNSIVDGPEGIVDKAQRAYGQFISENVEAIVLFLAKGGRQ
jgi:hypothetical protein